jgi:alginate O-acetyltransferase complex protein AlgI
MLFNSFEFILVFLPLCLLAYYALLHRRFEWALWILTGFCVCFYGWWNPIYLPMIGGSILANYIFGQAILELRKRKAMHLAKAIFASGIIFNLGLLGYFKYADFFISSANAALGVSWPLQHVVLPLAISFYTFTQITYLDDIRRGVIVETSFSLFALFVLFFPHLIAGPIVHYREMMPQFLAQKVERNTANDLAIGLTLFLFGLFKKVVLADTFALYSTPVFTQAAQGTTLGFAQAWSAALAFSFQLYFDFSGYSDMAIGLARFFGVKLPVNFNSPYKAANIIDFWRRWHITLSRFLREYLYVPLGGNRRGPRRRYVNLLLTMLLGGLWHGAGWTYVLWGALHGVYLVINHGWHGLLARSGMQPVGPRWLRHGLGVGVTFVAVVFAWVLFRAPGLDVAGNMMAGMLGLNAGSAALGTMANPALVLASGFAIAWLLPNTQYLLRDHAPALYVEPSPATPSQGRLGAIARSAVAWRPNGAWLMLVSTLGVLAFVFLFTRQAREFLYFQF